MNRAALNVSVRTTVTPADSEHVRRIVLSTGVFADHEVDVAVELVDERLTKGERSGYFFVFAEDSGETIGYSCYGPIACTVNRFDLFWIAVDRRFHHQGIGRLILAESERCISSMAGERIYIETSSREDYLPTRSFYLRNGYEVTAHLPDFYGSGDDKIVLMKNLLPLI